MEWGSAGRDTHTHNELEGDADVWDIFLFSS